MGEATPSTQSGQGEERRSPELALAAAVLTSARILAAAIREAGTAAAVRILAPQDTGDEGITLTCPGAVTLFSKKTASETEDDGPGGQNAAQVQAGAIALASAAAMAAVAADLARQAALVHCPPECTKIVHPAIVGVVGTTVTVAKGWLIDSYTATVTAEGTQLVECVLKKENH